ncbi:InlB B-repeat-containing protein [Bifidobacterium mellis]|uniref:RCC1 domain-containing protein n=1 Tax=Bifidobacterium mellis TaxID=1293823 RepID=UPI0030B81E88
MSPSKATPSTTPLSTPSPLSTTSPLNTAQLPSPTIPAPNKRIATDEDLNGRSQPRSSAQYTVTFNDPEQQTSTEQKITDGNRVSRPVNPSRIGYIFDGWLIGDTPVAYDFSQPVTGDITLTAHWIQGSNTWSLNPVHGPASGNTKVTLTPPVIPNIRFSQISAGNNFAVALGSDGNIYSWGSNQKGQLGRTASSSLYDPNPTPGKVDRPANVPSDFTWVQVSAGNTFALALGSDGILYSWGDNDFYELGRDGIYNLFGGDQTPRPVDKQDTIKFTRIKAAANHAMAFDSLGNLYSWGWNEYGQLGHDGGTQQVKEPAKVDKPANASSNFSWVQANGGFYDTIAIGSDGNLYSWGNNDFDQLGRDTTDTRKNPIPGKIDKPAGVPSDFTWLQTGSAHYNSMALGSDGNIYTWGSDLQEVMLGRDLSLNAANRPAAVYKPANVNYIDCMTTDYHSMGLGSDGNLYSWGTGGDGELGHATPVSGPGIVTKPDSGKDDFTWKQASINNGYTMGLGSDGYLYTWGFNYYGELGHGAAGDKERGVVSTLGTPDLTGTKFDGTTIKDLSKNTNGNTWSATAPPHAKGKADVTVQWTINGASQPDVHLTYRYDGPKYTVSFSNKDKSCPASSDMPQNQSVTEGGQAVRPYPDPKADGCLFDGWFIKDANGDSKVAYDFSQPVTGDVALIAHWSQTNSGGWSINPIKGSSMGGQQVTITPPKTSRGIRFNQVSAGGYQMSDAMGFSVGVASDGNAYAWGSNQHGQLGIGNTAKQNKPVKIPLPDGVDSTFTYTQVAAGGFHVLAIGSDQIVYSWGANDHGQLGDNTTVDHSTPHSVPDPSDTSRPFKAVQVSAGAYDSAAIDLNGNVYTWGSEGNSRDGDFNPSFTQPQKTPAPAAAPDGSGQGLQAVQVSLGWSFILALDADGNAYAWGYNNYGQLGNNSTSSTYTATPAKVRDPNSPEDPNKGLQATQISAGTDHGLAIDKNGAVLSWGHNNSGQLGNSSTYDQPVPKPVKNSGKTGNFTAVSISAGVIYSLAVDSAGNTWGWGYNAYGQVGNGDVYPLQTPTKVLSTDSSANTGESLQATQISAAQYHSLAIGRDGNAYAWGDNTYGQLGNGSLQQSRKPTSVAFNQALLITSVRFDKTVVNSLLQNPDQSVSLTTPAHNPGQADVIVDWTLGGIMQPQAHLAYTYEGMLPHAGSSGTLILLAAGMLAAAGAAAAGRNRRESRNLRS